MLPRGKRFLSASSYAQSMAEVLIFGVVGAVLAAAFCLFRAVRMLGSWRAAPARVWRSDYTDAQQSDDFWSFGATLGTVRGWNWRDGDHSRLIEDEIVYTLTDGSERRGLVRRQVRRGWRPDAAYVVWYDPADPARVTAFGPFSWLLYAMLIAFLLGLLAVAAIERGLPLSWPLLG
jgi:hypothetical protein